MVKSPDMINVFIIKAPINNIEFQKILKEIFLIDDERINILKGNIEVPIGTYPVDIALTRGNALYTACERHGIVMELDYAIN